MTRRLRTAERPRSPERGSTRTASRAVLVALGAALTLACDRGVSLRLSPQSATLLDGLDGSIRVYSVPAEFSCPGSVLDNGMISTLWPDLCTDRDIEPFVRSEPERTIGGATLVREVAVAGSMPSSPVGELAAGRYAFVYVGVRDGCDVAALGCTVVGFPADIRIAVAPPVAGACLAGCALPRPTSACVSCSPAP